LGCASGARRTSTDGTVEMRCPLRGGRAL
jgi:hypothetical protein